MADEIKATAPASDAPRESHAPRPTGDRPMGDRPSGGGDRPRFGGGGRSGPGGPPREGGGGRKFFRRKKVCKFCTEKIENINYKDYRMLGQFVAESGKIVPRRLTGVCSPHQHRLSNAIKQARNIALLPFAGRAS
ncbi:MAG TPA: 30S ribosomal protein S18 [Candidatus Sulfotelmatobacter sp.]